MRVAERLFSRNQWSCLLNDFADLVADKEYVKINYNDWRALSKPVASNISLELCSDLSGAPIMFIQSGAHTPIMLKANDGSLGDFLFDNIFSKEEQAMAYGYDSITAVSACEAASSAVSALEVKADYMNYDEIWVSNKYDHYADTVDSISTAKTTFQLNVDRCGEAQVYNGTTWSNTGITDRTCELANKIDQCPTFNDVNKMIDDKIKEKENVNMKGFNFDFGPCGNTVRLSMYGMAIQNIAGEWVSYNPDSCEIINVDVFNIPDGGKYMYKMPVAISDVAVGDVVIHNRAPMFVTAIGEDGTFTVTDVRAGESKTIIPTRNMFNFNYLTKVVSLFGAFADAPTADQPFGNILPFLMMGEGNKDIDPIMLMFMMGQGGNFTGNPMMMYFLMKDNKDIDPMMLFMLMNQNISCNCGKTPMNPAAQV